MRRIRLRFMASRVSTARSRAQERLPASSPCEDTKWVQLSPSAAGAPVHQRDEAPLVAGHVVGERDRRVVARHEQQAVQQRLEPHPPPARQQPDAGSLVAQRGGRDPHRGRAARRARSRAAAVMIFVRLAIGSTLQRPVAPEHRAAPHVEEKPGARRLLERDLDAVRAGERHLGHGLGGHDRIRRAASPRRRPAARERPPRSARAWPRCGPPSLLEVQRRGPPPRRGATTAMAPSASTRPRRRRRRAPPVERSPGGRGGGPPLVIGRRAM